MEKNFYFKHDASAFSDAKLMNLVRQEGMTGYGIYWVILEFLRMQHEYSAPYVMLSHLSKRANTSSKRLKRIISNYDLFVLTDDRFYSPGLFERMLEHDHSVSSASDRGRRAAEARWLKINGNDDAHAMPLVRESNHIITSLKSESEANSCSSKK